MPETAKLNYRDKVKIKVEIDKAKQNGSITHELAEKYKKRLDKMI